MNGKSSRKTFDFLIFLFTFPFFLILQGTLPQETEFHTTRRRKKKQSQGGRSKK
jgi:hypothetical protein